MEQSNYHEWGQLFDERMKIRRQVIEALDLTLPNNVDEETRESIRRSMINCVGCTHTPSCLDWLRTCEAGAGPPEFCPNKDVFRMLERENG